MTASPTPGTQDGLDAVDPDEALAAFTAARAAEREARRGVAAGLTYRPVRPDELEACTGIWRAAIDDYTSRLAQPPVPEDVSPLVRLYQHLQATDPDRFVVATEGEARLVAFAAAVRREHLWFLSMCFVRPELQGAGVGRELLRRVGGMDEGDGVVRATATDSAQPISNALYGSLGITPRIPLLNLVGTTERPEAFGELPSGIRPVAFEEVAADGDGHRRLAGAVDALDRELLGVAHPVDHRYLRLQERRGWLYSGPDGEPIGYGYASEAGRVGPVAIRDEALLPAVLGHLTTAVTPRGAFAIWMPGTAGAATAAALQAGYRLDAFPLLLCWDRPFADFGRYLPISPGLL